jgi:hypothetical protein
MSSPNSERKTQVREERAIDRAIEDTRDNANKIIREVGRDVPENTASFHDYQQTHIRAVRETTNDFLDSQKEIAKSLQSAFRPLTHNVFTSLMFWPFSAMNPQNWTENYVKAATNFSELAGAAFRLENDLMSEALESTRLLAENVQKNTKELGKLGVESARAMERMSQTAYGFAMPS